MRYRCPRPTGEPTSPTGCRGRSLRSARGAMAESHGHWRARGCDLDGSAETGSLEGIVTHLGPLEVDARARPYGRRSSESMANGAKTRRTHLTGGPLDA